jgi:hypothetical protein
MGTLLAFLDRNILEVPFWISVIGLACALGFQLVRRTFIATHAKRIFFYSTSAVALYLIYIGFLQYKIFLEGPLGLTLGGRENLPWFLGYVSLHFWNEFIVSFPIAILFAWIGYFFNKKYQERFFEKEELYLIALGILLVGYPGFLFYIPFVLLASIIVSAISMKRGERLPLYYFWMPVAIAVVFVIHFWASQQLWWAGFRF